MITGFYYGILVDLGLDRFVLKLLKISLCLLMGIGCFFSEEVCTISSFNYFFTRIIMFVFFLLFRSYNALDLFVGRCFARVLGERRSKQWFLHTWLLDPDEISFIMDKKWQERLDVLQSSPLISLKSIPILLLHHLNMLSWGWR